MESLFEFVFFIVMVGCITGTIHKVLDVVALKHKREAIDGQSLKAELASMRQEMAALRTWANDLILSFDSTLHQQDQRLQSLERHGGNSATRSPIAAGETAPEVLELRPRA